MVTEQQIKLARDKFKEISGITIYTPDEGTLDDFEQSRYDGLVAALEAALSAQVQDADEQRTETCQRCQGNGEIVTDWRYRFESVAASIRSMKSEDS